MAWHVSTVAWKRQTSHFLPLGPCQNTKELRLRVSTAATKGPYRRVAAHVPAASAGDGRGQAAQVDGRQALLRQAVAEAAGQAPGTLAALGLGAVQGDLQHRRTAAGSTRHGKRKRPETKRDAVASKPGFVFAKRLTRVADCRWDFTGVN